MIVVNDGGNLVYDSESPLCEFITTRTFGQNYAFIQCIDASPEEHAQGKNRGLKRYWGPFDWDTKEQDIEGIMETGGKWPTLPELPSHD